MACLGKYTAKILYLITLASVFTCLLSSTSLIVHGGDESIRSGQEMSYSVLSEPTTEKNVASEENLTAYVRLFPGADKEILNSCSRVEEWDEDAGIAAVCVKPELIEDLSSLKGVDSVQPVVSPVIRKIDLKDTGFFSSTNIWTESGVTGTGINIGIISDGVEDISYAVESGALPDNIHVLSPGNGTEGTVILEVVHEVSPGAELYFHSAGNNKLEFNKAIDALIAQGCQIICDDVGWPDEPFFEDGIVAAHVKEVIDNYGILYVSAAGNDAGRHYQGMFYDDGSGWHDFSSGTSSSKNLYLDVPPGEKVTVVLQWNDPWNSSENDYDLYFYDRYSGEELAASERVQSGTSTPLEYILYTNREEDVKNVSISVKKHSGEDKILEVFIYANSSVKIYPDNLVEDDSVFGHPAVPEVICVGAVDSRNSQSTGIASYSSRGPVSIYYPAYELRNKTDLSGPGNVKVSGTSGKGSLFAGTSASAPSVAGIGALVWSMYPEKNSSEIREILCCSAEDMGDPGYDTVYGYGSVNSSTVDLLEDLYSGNSSLMEKSGVSPAEAGIFSLKISMPLELIYSMEKSSSGKK